MDKRTLYKVFGIRFDILVNGKVRVARCWVHPQIPGVAVPCPQEGAGKTSVSVFLGCCPAHSSPWEVLGKGTWRESPFHRSHLSTAVRSAVLSKKTHHDGLGGGRLWKVKTSC